MENLRKTKFLLFCSFIFLTTTSLFADNSNHIEIKYIVFLVLSLFFFIFFTISVAILYNYIKEYLKIKRQLKSIGSNGSELIKKSKKTNQHKVKISLTNKLIIVTVNLVILVIFLVSIPLSIIILNNQEQTLATGLQRRVSVLMDSISNGVKNYLPSQNILELNLITNQIDTLLEAQSITILSYGLKGNDTSIDYVWASNDPLIHEKIDTQELIYGVSKITDKNIINIANDFLSLNEETSSQVYKTTKQMFNLFQEYRNLNNNTDDKTNLQKIDLEILIKELNTKLGLELHQIANKNLRAIPPFDNTAISTKNTNYIFYQPIIYTDFTNDKYVHGLILLDVNTENLINALITTRREVIFSTLIISGLVILIGTIVSLILSFYIVKPIKTLQQHVEMISNTENKAELQNKKINIKAKDEIGVLSANINEMTENLAKAAVYETMLLGGKEIQRAFLPLDTVDDANKVKLSVSHIETENVQFFGYYEGAKGVSGDYFDFKNLDERHFALIKCDVSGKGTPAALIMAEVSTLFCDYFRNWTYQKDGINLQKLVYKINDHLESRNLKGKFAAFTLGIFDTLLGDIYFCNAGDNIIHIYDSSEKKQKTITLPSTPATGIFSSSIIEQKGGFPTVKIHLNTNDVLFLYTDGIEDSKRFFRNSENEIIKFIPNSDKPIENNTDINGIDGEEFGKERIKKIIESVFLKEKYQLIKKENPITDKNLKMIFDFTTLTGSTEDVIMALVSVEKIFRLYQTTSKYDYSLVDKKIDKFLQQHFNRYDTICNSKEELTNIDLKDEYINYISIKEEDQTDDLTLVAIKKK